MVAMMGSHRRWLSRITLQLLAVWAGVNILILLSVVVENFDKEQVGLDKTGYCVVGKTKRCPLQLEHQVMGKRGRMCF